MNTHTTLKWNDLMTVGKSACIEVSLISGEKKEH